MDSEQDQTPGSLPQPAYPTRRKWLIGLAAVSLVVGGAAIAAAQSPQIMSVIAPKPPIEEPRLGGVPVLSSDETSTTPIDELRTSGIVAPDFVPAPDTSK